MIDPVLNGAFSIHHNKGTYALLLGSGVSTGAGIPTGWGIVVSLIRKLANLKNEECEPSPEEWYVSAFKQEPTYSRLVEQVQSETLDGYRTTVRPRRFTTQRGER